MLARKREATSVISSTPAPFTILVVEDDPSDVELLLHAIEEADLRSIEGELRFEVKATGEGALQVLNERPVDLVICDLVLPTLDGLDLVRRIQELDRNLPVLVVTRLNAVSTAVDAIRRGAYDYILKPVHSEDLGMRLHRAIRVSEILRRNSAFERTEQQRLQAGSWVGSSSASHEIVRRIEEAASVRSTVLITGETGTGKGLIARAIHEKSAACRKLFQIIDCTTVPEGMVESELFGHVRGAFTGAVSDKPGLIELANGGSVFLDEIGDLPLPLQSKLLRVLEDSEVRRLGGTQVKRVDMRFIAASNQDLAEKVRAGAFRKDLYYRLAVFTIHVPPLRERVEDVALIARRFVAQFGREMGKPHSYLDAGAMAELTAYAWPGNARELRNVIERAIMLARQDAITAADIAALLPSNRMGVESPYAAHIALPYMEAKDRAVAEFTSAYLKAKLALHDDHITRAAEDSGIPRQHFSLLMKRYLGRDGKTNNK